MSKQKRTRSSKRKAAHYSDESEYEDDENEPLEPTKSQENHQRARKKAKSKRRKMSSEEEVSDDDDNGDNRAEHGSKQKVKQLTEAEWEKFLAPEGTNKSLSDFFVAVKPEDIVFVPRTAQITGKTGKTNMRTFVDVKYFPDRESAPDKKWSVSKWTVPLHVEHSIAGGDGTLGMKWSPTYKDAKFLINLSDKVDDQLREVAGDGWETAVASFFQHMRQIQDRLLEKMFAHDSICAHTVKKHRSRAKDNWDRLIATGAVKVKAGSAEYRKRIIDEALRSFKQGAQKFLETEDGQQLLTARRSVFRAFDEKQRKTVEVDIERMKEQLKKRGQTVDDFISNNSEAAPLFEHLQRRPLRVANPQSKPFPPPSDYRHALVTRNAYVMVHLQLQVFGGGVSSDAPYGCSAQISSYGSHPEVLLYRMGDEYKQISQPAPVFAFAEQGLLDMSELTYETQSEQNSSSLLQWTDDSGTDYHVEQPGSP